MYGGGNLTPTHLQQLQGQNTAVGIRLIELIEPFDTLNYKPFLNIAFNTFSTCFCFHLCKTESFALKTEPRKTISDVLGRRL